MIFGWIRELVKPSCRHNVSPEEAQAIQRDKSRLNVLRRQQDKALQELRATMNELLDDVERKNHQ